MTRSPGPVPPSGHPWAVLDVVTPAGRQDGGAPLRLVVTEVRRYRDGTYRYSVDEVEDGDGDGAGIYEAAMLEPLEERLDLTHFALPGPFAFRDIVEIAIDYPETEYAGKLGVLTPTGRRAPRLSASETEEESALVSGDGEVLGAERYVVVDDLDFHR